MSQTIVIGPAPTKLLPLADVSAQTGGAPTGEQSEASCACCAAPAGHAETPVEASVVAEYAVAGMTCANCVKHVTADVSEVDGVTGVEVDLVAGGVSTVRVLSDRAIDPALVAEAVVEAGYEVVAR